MSSSARNSRPSTAPEVDAAAVAAAGLAVLSPPKAREPHPAVIRRRTLLAPGTEVDHFVIRSLVARGGMGEVYVAWDQKLDREVALKVIRGKYRLDPCAKERFLREARALSQLEHPAISRIYDYVEGAETDYIVLELIRGRDLLEALESGLDHGLKLRLAQEIAEVLVAAHSKGIIHRDLKPENIMLTDDRRVKVLDFGLAKAASAPDVESVVVMTQRRHNREARRDTPGSFLADTTTRAGEIVGTPAYMSPEQARGERATPASDMFSFGLVLQHLFTGEPPYDLDQGQQRILSRARKAITRPLSGLDPDLTQLIERLKARAPGARPSAPDTVERLRFIRDWPRRLRLRLLVASAIGAVLLFAVAMSVQAYRIANERDRANREAEVSQEVSDFLVNLFEVSDPNQSTGTTVTARELLDQGAERLASEDLRDPAIQVRMMGTVGRIYQSLGLYQDSATLLERAMGQAERLNGEGEELLAGLHHELGDLYRQLGDLDRAEAELERGLAMRRETLGPDHPEVGEDLLALAGLHFTRSDFARAQELCEQSIAVWEAAGDPRAVGALSNLAMLLYERGRFGEAEEIYRRLFAATADSDEPDLEQARRWLNYSNLLLDSGKLAEAERFQSRALEVYERVFKEPHRRKALAMNNLAYLYLEQNRLAEAEELAEKARVVFDQSVGEEDRSATFNLSLLSELYRRRGRLEEAQELGEKALEIQERLLGENHPFVPISLHRLARLYQQQGKWEKAEASVLRALTVRKTIRGDRHPFVAFSYHELALLRAAQGRFEEAIRAEEDMLNIGEATLRAGHPALLKSREHLHHLRLELEASGQMLAQSSAQ